MYVKNLRLINFRNYKDLDLTFHKGVNILVGDNAQGKTNILESIYYCSLGKSHRTNRDKELINWDYKNSYISLYVCRDRLDKKIDFKIFKEGKKGINVNSIKLTKVSDLIGNLNAVIFSPEDLLIIKGAPSYRRKFLDMEICKLNKKYYYELSRYKKILHERNTVLKKATQYDILDVYDEQLSESGAYITKERLKYIAMLNEEGNYIHKNITSNKENIKIQYMSSLRNYDNINHDLLNLLKNRRKNDIYKKNTSVGPHRDDFLVYINNIDTRNYGSQGQQRTSVLTIKFASLKVIKKVTGDYPVLLLDDVLSELDTKRQKYILNSIENVQTIITCTGIEDIKRYLKTENIVYKVEDGNVKKIR